MSSNFAINVSLTASLNQVWSMLNSAQVSVHSPMFEKLKTPANALSLNKFLISIATFDLVDTGKWVDPLLYDYLPQEMPYSLNFGQCGFDSMWLIVNNSFFLWLYISHFVAILLVFLPVWAVFRYTGKFAWFKDKLAGYFLWNGMIRFFMETFLEFFLSSLLNVTMAVWGSPHISENYSIIVSLVVLALTAALILTYLVLSCKNFS